MVGRVSPTAWWRQCPGLLVGGDGESWLVGDDRAFGLGVFEPGWVVDGGLQQLVVLGWRVGIDVGAVSVDHDVVVVPAHGGQVLRVAAAAIDPWRDVMYVEAIAAGAARNRACCTVPVHDEAAQLGRDRPGSASLEPEIGFEPTTYALRVRCSTGLSYPGGDREC